MPDVNKLELQLKSQDMRMASLERAIDSLKKSVLDSPLAKRIDALEKNVAVLTATMATKKDAKSEAEIVKANAEKMLKAAMADIDKLNLHTKLVVLEARLHALEGRHSRQPTGFDYFPVQHGVLFSRNAPMPSCASAAMALSDITSFAYAYALSTSMSICV